MERLSRRAAPSRTCSRSRTSRATLGLKTPERGLPRSGVLSSLALRRGTASDLPNASWGRLPPSIGSRSYGYSLNQIVEEFDCRYIARSRTRKNRCSHDGPSALFSLASPRRWCRMPGLANAHVAEIMCRSRRPVEPSPADQKGEPTGLNAKPERVSLSHRSPRWTSPNQNSGLRPITHAAITSLLEGSNYLVQTTV